MKQRQTSAMTPDEVSMAFAALDRTPRQIAKITGFDIRSVYRWRSNGAPPHIGMLLDLWIAGRISERSVPHFVKLIGRSRDDTHRYR